MKSTQTAPTSPPDTKTTSDPKPASEPKAESGVKQLLKEQQKKVQNSTLTDNQVIDYFAEVNLKRYLEKVGMQIKITELINDIGKGLVNINSPRLDASILQTAETMGITNREVVDTLKSAKEIVVDKVKVEETKKEETEAKRAEAEVKAKADAEAKAKAEAAAKAKTGSETKPEAKPEAKPEETHNTAPKASPPTGR